MYSVNGADDLYFLQEVRYLLACLVAEVHQHCWVESVCTYTCGLFVTCCRSC